MEAGGVGKGGVGGQGRVEGGEVAAVRAAVEVEAVGVGVSGDSGEGDGAVVGAVRLVVENELGDVGGEGGRAGGEGVIDVGGEAALQGGDVDCVKGITQGETRDGAKNFACVEKKKWRPASAFPYMGRVKAQTASAGSPESGGAWT